MPFDEIPWLVLALTLVLIGIWRSKSFYVRLGLALDWVGANISETLAIVQRILAALLMGFVLVYFLVTSVQMLVLKPAVFHRCLPEKHIVERILKCVVGDPYNYIKKSNV
jgi:hypothetical protein